MRAVMREPLFFRKDFCRSDERKSWRTAVPLVPWFALPGTHRGFYTESSPAGAQDWRRCSPALRLAVFPLQIQ